MKILAPLVLLTALGCSGAQVQPDAPSLAESIATALEVVASEDPVAALTEPDPVTGSSPAEDALYAGSWVARSIAGPQYAGLIDTIQGVAATLLAGWLAKKKLYDPMVASRPGSLTKPPA